jgi:hypothetical protein
MQCVSSVAVVLSTHTKRLTLRLYVLLSVLLPSTLWRKHVCYDEVLACSWHRCKVCRLAQLRCVSCTGKERTHTHH